MADKPDAIKPYIHDLLAPVCKNRAANTYDAGPNGKLPDEFLVYFLVSKQPRGFFSGKPCRSNRRYQASYYTRDRAKLDPALTAIEQAMTAGGFLHAGAGPELEHQETGHWSVSCDFRWIEEE
ncbi:MAG: hypothetical protein FWE69_03835 [Clostridiales bacterium]|nr:hypothetical protein [Clostridiales bacterium]